VTRRITLLGDAIHAMTRFCGIGANVALEGAQRLGRALVAAARGECNLADTLNSYEAGMRNYGFRAVPNSLKAIRQTVTDNTPALTFSRMLMRAIDALPPLKRRLARRLDEG
jgi:2-polyprenyl-6-methoxyphenol hydroxylase-like FAD-dependent oxidoreductase